MIKAFIETQELLKANHEKEHTLAIDLMRASEQGQHKYLKKGGVIKCVIT